MSIVDYRRWVIIIAVLVPMLLGICVATSAGQIKAQSDSEFARILTIVPYELDPKIPIEPITGTQKTSLVMNPGKTRRAFIACLPAEKTSDACRARVFITDIRSGKTYMIRGEPDEMEIMRPIDELKWPGDGRLSYERWAGPHFGHRYLIDVIRRKQTAGFALTDLK